MKQLICVVVIVGAVVISARADGVTEQVQRTLKEQGFYYGEVTGRMDADTTAAIRRYQIRNGLQVTGELTAETRKALGISGAPQSTPRPTERPRPPETPPPVPQPRNEPATTPPPGYAPGPRGLRPEMSGIFDGTPFEVAPADVQQRVIVGAQTLLLRNGYYRGGIDGKFGSGTAGAVREFQADAGLAVTGRLDMETLAALGLLPGQQMPGYGRPRRRWPARIWRRPQEVAPNGEPIYRPRY